MRSRVQSKFDFWVQAASVSSRHVEALHLLSPTEGSLESHRCRVEGIAASSSIAVMPGKPNPTGSETLAADSLARGKNKTQLSGAGACEKSVSRARRDARTGQLLACEPRAVLWRAQRKGSTSGSASFASKSSAPTLPRFKRGRATQVRTIQRSFGIWPTSKKSASKTTVPARVRSARSSSAIAIEIMGESTPGPGAYNGDARMRNGRRRSPRWILARRCPRRPSIQNRCSAKNRRTCTCRARRVHAQLDRMREKRRQPGQWLQSPRCALQWRRQLGARSEDGTRASARGRGIEVGDEILRLGRRGWGSQQGRLRHRLDP